MHWSICMGKMFLEMWEKYFQSTKHTAKQGKINMKRIYGFLTDKIKHMKSFSHNWMRKIYQSGNLYGSLTFEFYLVWNCDDIFFLYCVLLDANARCVCAEHLGAVFRFIRMSLIDIYGSKGWKFITANLVDDGLLFVCPRTLLLGLSGISLCERASEWVSGVWTSNRLTLDLYMVTLSNSNNEMYCKCIIIAFSKMRKQLPACLLCFCFLFVWFHFIFIFWAQLLLLLFDFFHSYFYFPYYIPIINKRKKDANCLLFVVMRCFFFHRFSECI